MRPIKIFAFKYGPGGDTFIGIWLGFCKLLNRVRAPEPLQTKFRAYTYVPASSFDLPNFDQILCMFHLILTLPVRSYLVPTPSTKGGGGGG